MILFIILILLGKRQVTQMLSALFFIKNKYTKQKTCRYFASVRKGCIENMKMVKYEISKNELQFLFKKGKKDGY